MTAVKKGAYTGDIEVGRVVQFLKIFLLMSTFVKLKNR